VQADFDTTNTTLFVGGLANTVTEADLTAVFQPYGVISHVRVPPSKGCGFVQFTTRKAAEMALQTVHGTVVKGCTLRVSWGRNAAKPGRSNVATPPLPHAGAAAHFAPQPAHHAWGAYAAGYQAATGVALPQEADAAPHGQHVTESQCPAALFGTVRPDYYDVERSNSFIRSLRVPMMGSHRFCVALHGRHGTPFEIR
jgi:RNA recognition motif-containing protein